MQVQINTAGGPVPGHLAVPTGQGPWPGVVVVHDAFGLSADIKSLTGRFAAGGYLALAPDLYARGGTLRCIKAVISALLAGSGRAVDDLLAARDWLGERTDCTGRVGIAGFCMGGGFALVLAPQGFDASAPWYGALPRGENALDGACPVVASFGGRDIALRGAAAKLRDRLSARDVPHDVKEYPEAGHCFANRLPFGPQATIQRITGFGYHEESSEDSWRRVLRLFDEHLAAGR